MLENGHAVVDERVHVDIVPVLIDVIGVDGLCTIESLDGEGDNDVHGDDMFVPSNDCAIEVVGVVDVLLEVAFGGSLKLSVLVAATFAIVLLGRVVFPIGSFGGGCQGFSPLGNCTHGQILIGVPADTRRYRC